MEGRKLRLILKYRRLLVTFKHYRTEQPSNSSEHIRPRLIHTWGRGTNISKKLAGNRPDIGPQPRGAEGDFRLAADDGRCLVTH
ncbi:hypothetical protein BgiBS90_007512 [Biomphalaria glabrata]|nr:hypothetical protein BgiBS90_007512 [Biomphalaria glabrata]